MKLDIQTKYKRDKKHLVNTYSDAFLYSTLLDVKSLINVYRISTRETSANKLEKSRWKMKKKDFVNGQHN